MTTPTGLPPGLPPGQSTGQSTGRSAPEATTLVEVTPERWHEVFAAARSDGYRVFDWLAGIDETDRRPDPALVVVCQVLRPPGNGRTGVAWLRASTRLADEASLASLTDLWAGAAWHERETFEMLGIGFTGFDDGTGRGLRRLLLSPDAPQTPLRKDAPLQTRLTTAWPGGGQPGTGLGARRRRPAGMPAVAEPGRHPVAGPETRGEPR